MAPTEPGQPPASLWTTGQPDVSPRADRARLDTSSSPKPAATSRSSRPATSSATGSARPKDDASRRPIRTSLRCSDVRKPSGVPPQHHVLAPVAQHPRVGRTRLQGRHQRVHRQARLLAVDQPFGHPGVDPREDQLVHGLAGLSRPGRSEVGDPRAEGLQHRHGLGDGRLGSAREHRQRAALGPFRAARDGRVHEQPAIAVQVLGELAGEGR